MTAKLIGLANHKSISEILANTLSTLLCYNRSYSTSRFMLKGSLMLHFYLTTIFFCCIGLYMIWRGRAAIRDKFMSNGLKSTLVTGITHVDGKKAVLAGKFYVIIGSIIVAGSVLVLMGGIIFSASRSLQRWSSKSSRMAAAQEIAKQPPRSDRQDATNKTRSGNTSSTRSKRATQGTPDAGQNSQPRGRNLDWLNSDDQAMTAQPQNKTADPDVETNEKLEEDLDKFHDRVQMAIDQGPQEMMKVVENALEEHGLSNPNNANTFGSQPGVDSVPAFESAEIDLGQPTIALPKVSFDKEQAIKSQLVGFKLADGEVIDTPPEGGVIVGLIVGKGGLGKEIINVQAVYQCHDEYVLGEAIGKEGGERTLLKAPSGFVVFGLSVHSGVGINAIRLGYMKMDERGRLKKSTAEYSDWIGDPGRGREKIIDGEGKVVVGLFGAFRHGKDLAAIGLIAAKRIEVAESAVESNDESRIRNWNSASGNFSVNAKYMEEKDGKVKLKKEDGAEIWVKIEALSDEDQAWIEQQD